MDIYLFIFICTLSMAVFSGFTSMLWQFWIGRDKQINETAQLSALEKESASLEAVREQLNGQERFNEHHKVLSDNREEIKRIDEKIMKLFAAKAATVEAYSKLVKEMSTMLIQTTPDNMLFQGLVAHKSQLEQEIFAYDEELHLLQAERTELWGEHHTMQENLLSEESQRNKNLDLLFHRHTDVLEKIYLGHAEHTNQLNNASLEATKEIFNHTLSAPVQLVSSLWNQEQPERARIIEHALNERNARVIVRDAEVSANMDEWLEVDGPQYIRLA